MIKHSELSAFCHDFLQRGSALIPPPVQNARHAEVDGRHARFKAGRSGRSGNRRGLFRGGRDNSPVTIALVHRRTVNTGPSEHMAGGAKVAPSGTATFENAEKLRNVSHTAEKIRAAGRNGRS